MGELRTPGDDSYHVCLIASMCCVSEQRQLIYAPVINGYKTDYSSIDSAITVMTDLLLVQVIAAVERMIIKQHIFVVSPCCLHLRLHGLKDKSRVRMAANRKIIHPLLAWWFIPLRSGLSP